MESLLAYNQVLCNADLRRAPLVGLNASSKCGVFFPYLSFLRSDTAWTQAALSTDDKPCPKAQLQDIDLRGAKLYMANFQFANLHRADLSPYINNHANDTEVKTEAQRVDFSGANLSYSNLEKANLSDSLFRNADLANANLIGANLSGADLRGADLRRALLRNNKGEMVRLCETRIDKNTLGIEVLASIPSACKKEGLTEAGD